MAVHQQSRQLKNICNWVIDYEIAGLSKVKSTVSTAEAILSELKDIKSYVAELAGYSIDEKGLEKEVKK